MRVQAGLRADDWDPRGTHHIQNQRLNSPRAASPRSGDLLLAAHRSLAARGIEEARLMPALLEAVAAHPPRVFVIQTRGPLILRDLSLLQHAAATRAIRVSFSITTDRDDVRRIFEPHCASIEERWRVVETLRDAGIETSVAIAPILPCDPEALVARAFASSGGPVIADPFHVRAVKRSGATTRPAALAICDFHGWREWLDQHSNAGILDTMSRAATAAGRTFGHGPRGFGLLGARNSDQ